MNPTLQDWEGMRVGRADKPVGQWSTLGRRWLFQLEEEENAQSKAMSCWDSSKLEKAGIVVDHSVRDLMFRERATV